MNTPTTREAAALREALDTLTLVVGLTAIKHPGQIPPLQEAMDKARAALTATATAAGGG